MKKSRIFVCIVMALFCIAILAGCAPKEDAPAAEKPSAEAPVAEEPAAEEPAEDDGVWTVGMTISDLTNAIWAAHVEYIEAHAAEHGMEFVVMGAQTNSATQVQQVESFIQSGVDALYIWAVDGQALNEAQKKAKDAGIFIVNHQVGADSYDTMIDIDEYENGYAIGTLAANYINDNLGGEAKVGVFSYDIMEAIVARGDGLKAAIAELAPNAEVVAEATVGTTAEGMEAAENFLQAHPDMDVIACINDAGAIGANETAKAAGMDEATFAIFGCDATIEALQAMKDGPYFKGTVSLGGTPGLVDDLLFPALEKAKKGEEVPELMLLPIEPVNMDNYPEYAEKFGYALN